MKYYLLLSLSFFVVVIVVVGLAIIKVVGNDQYNNTRPTMTTYLNLSKTQQTKLIKLNLI